MFQLDRDRQHIRSCYRFIYLLSIAHALIGNAIFLIPNIRNGILLHTGEWADWNPSLPMPNSHGCVHAHPEDIQKIWKILVGLGVKVHENPFGQLPYPYPVQGVVSVEQLD